MLTGFCLYSRNIHKRVKPLIDNGALPKEATRIYSIYHSFVFNIIDKIYPGVKWKQNLIFSDWFREEGGLYKIDNDFNEAKNIIYNDIIGKEGITSPMISMEFYLDDMDDKTLLLVLRAAISVQLKMNEVSEQIKKAIEVLERPIEIKKE